MNSHFHNVRKGDKFYKFVWRSNLGTDYGSGRDVAEAFGNAGYQGGALAALDYHAQVYPCLNCDFVGDSKEEKRKHRCAKN